MQKTGGSSSITNNHLNNQNLIIKDIVDIPNKTPVNQVRVPILMPSEKETNLKKHVKDIPKVKDSLMNIKEVIEDKEINRNDYMSAKESIHIKNDTLEKEQVNLSDTNNKKLNLKTRRKVNVTNNTSMFAAK